MIFTAIGFFSLAALLGMFLISYVLQNKETPKAVVFIHGGLAGTGIILLLVYSFLRSPSPLASLILFILAAFGGFLMVFRDLTGKSVPKSLAIIHGTTAIIGFVLLLIFALT